MKELYTTENKKMIFFDLNQTLVDEQETFARCFYEVLQDYIGRWDPGDSKPEPGKPLAVYRTEWGRRAKSTLPLSAKRMQCLTTALKPFPLAVTERFTESFFAKIAELKPSQLSLFPEVPETLHTLSRSYRLAIISNGSQTTLESLLGRLKLESFFPMEHLFSGKKRGMRKPSQAIFQEALLKTGMTPQQCVMVGNSWKNDVFGATRCGIDAVWFNPQHRLKWTQKLVGKEKVVVIRKIKQLLDIFQIGQ